MQNWQRDIIPAVKKMVLRGAKGVALSGLLLGAMPAVNAATVEINTQFIADLQNPQKNAFENQTPQSGVCVHAPQLCKSDDFGVLIQELTAEKYFDYKSTNLERNHTSISIDGMVKDVILRDVNTKNTITGKFRLAFIVMPHTPVNTNSGDLAGAMMDSRPLGGCERWVGYGSNGSGFVPGWRLPNQRVTCYKKLNSSTPDEYFQGNVRIRDITLGYKLDMPEPLKMPSGDYEGELVYSVGEGGQIDFHSESTSDTEIRIKIKATVRHAFQLKFPSEDTIDVRLAPKGGWSQWINGRRVPDSLIKEVPFTVSSSSGFTVKMTCDYYEGTGCALRQTEVTNGLKIPLEVSLTLPGYRTDAGRDVINMPLHSDKPGNEYVIVPPGEFIVNRRSKVDFKVQGPDIKLMLKSPGSTWRGGVTLVFDNQMD